MKIMLRPNQSGSRRRQVCRFHGRQLRCPEAETSAEKHLGFFFHKGLKSFPNGSSAGLDGFLPQFLNDLTVNSNGQTGLNFLRAKTNLVNVILKGKVPFELRPYIFGAKLIALKKARWRPSSYRSRQYVPLDVRKMCRVPYL